MTIVDISATLDGEATLGAGASATYAANSTFAGSSAQTADATRAYAASSSQAGSSAQSSSATATYAASSTLAGGSSQSAVPTATYAGSVGLPGGSSMAADASFTLGSDMAGTSTMGAVANVVYRGTVGFPAGSDMAIANMVELDADIGGSSTLAAQADVAANESVTATGSSSMSASATVKSAAVAAFSGSSTVVAGAEYLQIQITANMAGGSELIGHASELGAYGDDSYGGSPYGSAFPPFGLESALALSSTQVRIRYTAMFDSGFAPLLSTANYSVSPPVTINSIVLESAQSVLLNTSALSAPVYTVTISEAQGYFGQPLYAPLDSAQFTGIAAAPTFYAVATGRNRVRAVFSEPMSLNSQLTDPAQYVLTDLSGAAVAVSSVTTEQLADVRSTVLHLDDDLVDERHYRLTLLSGIVSAPPNLAPVSPDTSVFQWVENALRAQIPVVQFSGEIMEGLYGIHGGLVFFSPALETSASNSIIQVEQVDVCTRAYDEYHFPQPIDPSPLMTHGAGVVPTAIVTTLNSSDWVLWATFPRLVDARFELGMGTGTPLEDFAPLPMDATAVTLTESWPPDKVAILNNLDWKLFEVDGSTASITAVASGIVTITGLSGMVAGDVGKILTIKKAATTANNGNFLIVAFISSSSVQIRNSAGVAPDANNGALVWTNPGAFITADNLTPYAHPSITTVLSFTMPGGSTQGAEADLL